MTSLLYPALVSSIIESTLTHPIDVIKIHKQTSQPIIYKFKNLYSGYIPRAVGNIPSRTIFLFSQDYLQHYFNNSSNNNSNKTKYEISKNMQSIIIPLCAGFTQTLVDTPIEIIKMNQVMNIKNKLLYKGFIPHFCRNFIFVLSVYNFKQLGVGTEVGNKVGYGVGNSYLQTAMYGAVGGVVGSYISHPLDTIKTCIQTNRPYKHFIMKDYFRGCHLRAGMGMINMFVSLYVFEVMKKL
jgi:hypothetical protein